VSCLAEQAKILVAEAEDNNLDVKVWNERFARWHTCSLCEQEYHGVVRFALGCACWKTYVGRPETDKIRLAAISEVGNGLSDAKHLEDALSVREAELALKRRFITSEAVILNVQGSLATTYSLLGRKEEASRMLRDVYAGRLKLSGEEHELTLRAAYSYAAFLHDLQRFKEAKALMRRTLPVARRVLGESNDTLKMRAMYASALHKDPAATLDDIREAVTTIEDAARIARRVLGGAHPISTWIECELPKARAALRVRETGDVESIREAVAAMTARDA